MARTSVLSFGLLASALVSFVSVVQGQKSTTPALSSIPAAATVVSTDSKAGVSLFESEALQLTEEVLENVFETDNLAEYQQLFTFDDGSADISSSRHGNCKFLPGDNFWPKKFVWNLFDSLLGGALVPIIPIASPCYKKSEFDNYNEGECASIVDNWGVGATHTDNEGSVMWPLYQGTTCMPSLDPSGSCTQGGYSSFAVNVSNVAQIQLAVNFARATNVRLVIRNTGHDFNGRSTGTGALSLWTHHLKDIEFIPDHESGDYQGPAFKAGAGVQGFEIYEAAQKHGVTALSGLCPTVGFAGGYLAGGGHSPLMQVYGMAADQILAYEVVTANGRFITVTPTENADLFWALGGGGGGTFGIVTSVIVKAHPQISVTTSMINFVTSPEVSVDTFWEAVHAYWDLFLPFNDARTYSYFWINRVPDGLDFSMTPFYAPNHTIEEFNKLVKPWFDRLDELKIPFTAKTEFYQDFYSAYKSTSGTVDYFIGTTSAIPGVRLVPRASFETDSKRAATFEAVRDIVEASGIIGGYHQSTNNPDKIMNAVNPAFRNEAAMLIINAAIGGNGTEEDLKEAAESFRNDIDGPIRKLTVPDGGGAYQNEAAVNEPDWQQSFWGSNYERLLTVKKKWDPKGFFYVHHGVGSENWEVKEGKRGIDTQYGRLCQKSS